MTLLTFAELLETTPVEQCAGDLHVNGAHCAMGVADLALGGCGWHSDELNALEAEVTRVVGRSPIVLNDLDHLSFKEIAARIREAL